MKMLFNFLLAILGGGLLGAALPPAAPGPAPASHSHTMSSCTTATPSSSIGAAVSGISNLMTGLQGRENPGNTPGGELWVPECPRDNHAIAVINSKDLKTEYRISLECNTDRMNLDMPGSPHDQPDWMSCASACVAAYDDDNGCLAFTWRHDQAKCYLKSGIPNQSDFAEAWSGVITVENDNQGKFTNNGTAMMTLTPRSRPTYMPVARQI